MLKTFKELETSFKDLDGVTRTEYMMELGKQLPEMEARYKGETSVIYGCTSQAYLEVIDIKDNKVFIQAYSDSHFVKGLLYILSSYIQDLSVEEINNINHATIMNAVGIENTVSSTRTNGFYAAVKHLKHKLKVLSMSGIDRDQNESIEELKLTIKVLEKRINTLETQIINQDLLEGIRVSNHQLQTLLAVLLHQNAKRGEFLKYIELVETMIKRHKPDISPEDLNRDFKIFTGLSQQELNEYSTFLIENIEE